MSHSFEIASETLRVSTLMTEDPFWLYKIKKCFTTNCNDAMTFLGSIIALSQLMADRCNMHVLIYSAA